MTHYVYIVCGVVFVAFILRLIGLARASHIRRMCIRRRRGSGSHEQLLHGKCNSHNGLRAKRATLSNLAFVQVLPLSIYSRGNVIEWLFTLGYASVTLALGTYASLFRGELDYANPMGMIAVAQMTFIVGLAGRNNVLSALTGVSYEKLSYLHRAAGRTCVLTTALHIVGWLIKGLGKHGPWSWRFNTALPAAIGLGAMYLTSFQRVRNAMWELFLVVHISMGVMFIVATYFHTPEYRQWVWPAFVLWGLDRFVGLVRLVVLNKWWSCLSFRKRNAYSAIPSEDVDSYNYARRAESGGSEPFDDMTAKVELVSPEVMRITVHQPTLKWSAGSHMYISMPDVSHLWTEQHPFTIANVPQCGGDVLFIVRAHGGFTHRLLERVAATPDTENGNAQECRFRTHIEGPYGTPPRLDHYDSVLLVAGGTGVAYTLAHLLELVHAGNEGRSAVSAIRFVWNVRDISIVRAIAPELNAALERCADANVHIDIHVTRSAASDEPGPDLPWTQVRGLGSTMLTDPNPDGCASGPATPTTLSRSPSGTTLPGLRQEREQDRRRDWAAASSLSRVSALRGRPGTGGEKLPLPASKLAAFAGLDKHVARVTTFHVGRSHLQQILRQTLADSKAEAGGVAMAVCGPPALALDARAAVCRVNTAANVREGQNSVTFYSGNFGF